MTRIDRSFCSPKWERWFANPILQPMSPSSSDHCPLLLSPLTSPAFKPKFRFKSFWIDMPKFKETVNPNRLVSSNHNPLTALHIKLSRTAKALRIWSKTLLPQSKIALAVCREVVDQLEKAQEARPLIESERQLIKALQERILGLAAIEKRRARQKYRITWLKKGDVNSKYFHLMNNVRKKRNFIHTLQTAEGAVLIESERYMAIYTHFLQHTGTYVPRICSLNLVELGWEPHQLNHLELPFSEEEIRHVIMAASKEKAPRPDGCIGLFFSVCWDQIKADIIRDV
jgi:hypothetical protein